MKLNSIINNAFKKKSPDELIATSKKSELKKTLNVFDLIVLGIGAVVGTGIFTIIGSAIQGGPESVGAGPAIDFHDWELVDRAESDFDILDAGPFAADDVYDTLDLSHWNTRNVIFMQKAFKNCHYDLVGLENWDVSRVVDFSEAFCDYKPSSAIDGVLDLSNWKLNPTAKTQGMFRWCKADVIATDPTLLKALKADRLDQMWGVQYDI